MTGNVLQLDIIFNKSNGEYTDDALLYQKILSFSLSGADHQSFTNYKLCKWLKEHHQRFEKRSVDSLQKLVERKIGKLIVLQLVHEIGTQPISTGTGQTPVYAFDWKSYVLGWLIESLRPELAIRVRAINKVFNILWLILESDTPSSMNIFFRSLIQKMKERGLFSQLVKQMIEVLVSSNSIKDISDLVDQTLMFRHVDLNFVNKYDELWQETLNELEPKTRRLVMFRLKLLYEQRMLSLVIIVNVILYLVYSFMQL
jgi:hypothetical protein